MLTDRGSLAILAAGVQQALVRVDDLRLVAARIKTRRRRKLLIENLGEFTSPTQRGPVGDC
jgi:hypothetical protein